MNRIKTEFEQAISEVLLTPSIIFFHNYRNFNTDEDNSEMQIDKGTTQPEMISKGPTRPLHETVGNVEGLLARLQNSKVSLSKQR